MDINAINLLFCIMMLYTVFVIMHFDFLHPVVIIISTMTVSVFFSVLNVDKWNLFVGLNTAIFVSLSMLAYIVGAFLFKLKADNDMKTFETNSKIDLNVKCYKIIVVSFIMVVCLYFSFKEIYDISISLGNTQGIANMIKCVRYPLERGEVKFSRWWSYRSCIATSIAMVSLYYFCMNLIYGDRKKVIIRYCIPLMCYLPFTVLTTGRREIIHFVLAGVVMGCLIYLKKYNDSLYSKIRVFCIIAGSILCSSIIFLAMGTLTGKVSIVNGNFFKILSHYLGLSIPALDILTNSTLVETTQIGKYTLRHIYRSINSLGFNFEEGKGFLDFVYFDGINTNVYSILGRQYMDYGFTGTVLISCILGFFVAFCYNYVKISDENHISIIIYSMFAYVPFFLFIDDQFMTILNTTTIYKIILIYIVFIWFSDLNSGKFCNYILKR